MGMARIREPKRPPEGVRRRAASLAWLAAAVMAAGSANAQTLTGSAAAGATTGAGSAGAPGAGTTPGAATAAAESPRSLLLEPAVSARLTFTDNVGARADNERSDWILEVAPSIAVSREAGRFTGDLRAQLRNVAYANETDRSTSYLALQGRGEFEAIEQFLFVDVDAAISRNNRSDLFGRAPGDFLDVGRGNETRLFSIGPRAEFEFAGTGRGTASYLSRWLDGSGGLDGRRVGEWRVLLSDPAATGRFGWSLDYFRSDTRFNDNADTEVYQQTARATLFATVSPQFRLRGIVGRESTDYTDRDGESGTIKGGGFDWNPTERTTISATGEDRVFGRGYNFSFHHRRPLSTWDLSYSRDISSSLDTLGSVFDDPTFSGLYDAYEPIIPDPFQRERFVRELLGLTDPGLNEGFVTKAYFLDRRLRAGVSLVGARNVLSLSLLRSDRERLDTFTRASLGPEDDFAIFDRVRTDSATLALNHRISGLTGLNASFTRSRSKGSGTGTPRGETRRSILSLALNTSLSPRTTGGLSYRHQRADGVTDFIENVLSASLAIRF